MGTPALHQGASIVCAHGAPAQAVPTQARVKASGQALLTQADMASVAGCPFTLPGPVASPCVEVRWTSAALRVRIGGVPLLMQNSSSLCLAATRAPQGPATVAFASPRVKAL